MDEIFIITPTLEIAKTGYMVLSHHLPMLIGYVQVLNNSFQNGVNSQHFDITKQLFGKTIKARLMK